MKALLTSLALGFCIVTASAQVYPHIDIALEANANGDLDVKVRPDGAFDEIFSSLVFTIRWNTSDGASLGNISQQVPEVIYMPLAKSGPEIDDNGYRYQVFAGFGVQQMNAFGAAFVGGMEVTLMTIPVTALSTYEIVNDSWTGNSANNGDFYVSLNGSQTTTGVNPNTDPPIAGIVYGGAISTSVGDAVVATSGALVVPNPSNGNVQLHLADNISGDIMVELINSLGQVLSVEQVTGSSTAATKNYDLTAYQKGSYFFRVISEHSTETVPFVLQ